MLAQVTAPDLYASIVMLRTQGSQVFLLVEGDSEVGFFSSHLNDDAVRIVNCYGCENLERVASMAFDRADDQILGLRDRDWIDVLGSAPTPNVVLTDLYDLDSTLFFKTTAGARVIAVFSDQAKLASHCASANKSPVEIVAQLCAPVGLLRLVSERHCLGIKTQGTPFRQIEESGNRIDTDRLIEMCIGRTADCLHSAEHVRTHLDSELASGHEPVRSASGHDLGAVLAMLLSKYWGRSNNNAEFLLKAVRSAVTLTELKTLVFASAIESWSVRVVGKSTIWNSA